MYVAAQKVQNLVSQTSLNLISNESHLGSIIARRAYCVEAFKFFMFVMCTYVVRCTLYASCFPQWTFALFSPESIRKCYFRKCPTNHFWNQNLASSGIDNLYLVIKKSSKNVTFLDFL